MYYQRRGGLDTDPNAGGTNPSPAANTGGPLATDAGGGVVTGAPLPSLPPKSSSSSSSSSSLSSSSPADSTATTDVQQSPAQPIPLGAVIGAIVGSIIFLVLVIALVVWQSKKQKRKLMNRSVSTRRNYERRKSGREMAWKELSDDHSTTIEGGGGSREDKGGMALQSYPPQRTTATSVGTIPQLPKLSPIFDSKELKNVIGRDLTPSPATPQAPPDSSEPLRSNYIGHPYNNYSRGPSPPPAVATSPYKDEKATTKDVDSGNGGQDIQYKPFTHPYAKALVPPSPAPTTSSTSNPDDDKSFYTMSSPGLNNTSFSAQQQHQSSSSSQLLSNPPLSSAQPSSTILPLKTGDRSHNHNPFFTAHPSANEYNKSGRERWGSVGKERVVSIGSEDTITKGGGFLSPPDSTPPSGAGTGAERAPSRMESLIAALELSDGTGGGASNTVSPTPTIKGSEANNRAQRTQFGQLASLYSISSRASTQPGEFELAYGDAIGTNTTHYSNPFEFDEVYGIPKIHSEAEGGEVRDSFRSSGVGGLGTSTTADFSMQGSTMTDGSSSGLVLSPSEFPMPPPR